MGARGPAPKPLALKILNGSAAHDPQRMPRNPAQPAQVAPELPPDLSPRARDLWHETLAQQAPGVILAAHGPSLRAYVEAVARYEEAAVLLAGSGPLVRADGRGARRGELVKNPLVSIVRGEADLIRVFARELGLTPSSVSAFSNVRPAVPEDDPMLRLLTPIRSKRRA
ncbi:MAG: P27 family phage terminase small subunit [Chloroflexi bacterium]|nr:P27 family phage terminase small subunit [Chloroflexota bacterium]